MTRVVLASTFAFATIGAAACALDFDRFQPLAGDAAPSAGDAGSTDDAGFRDQGVLDEGSIDAAIAEVGTPDPLESSVDVNMFDGSAPIDASTQDVACTPLPSCIDSVRTCAMKCGQATCVKRCETTCLACTRAAGCPSAAICSMVAQNP